MIEISKEKFNSLTEKEKKYFRIMNAQSGVLFITAEPGVAKSAILRAIATKLGWNYFDIRLSMVDEIDVGLFPFRKDIEYNDGGIDSVTKTISLMSYAIPEWAYRANQTPTIIHFEELNRAPLAVRNAALQILLERAIGTDFHFNDNVFMVSSGNLGEEDGTDVEEFDRALNNRLIHVSHVLTCPEWIENFATENVHPVVVNFLKSNEQYFLHSADEKLSTEQPAYATPRSWTFLSDYIIKNYGMESSINDWVDDMREVSASYVGNGSSTAFIRYLNDSLRFGVNDLLDRYDEIEDMLVATGRDKKSELLNALKSKNLNNLTDKQKGNLKKFILILSKDEAVSFLLKFLDDNYKYMKVNDNDNDLLEDFLSDSRFEIFYDAILEHVPKIEE